MAEFAHDDAVLTEEVKAGVSGPRVGQQLAVPSAAVANLGAGVVQRKWARRLRQAQFKLEASSPGDAAEIEADAAAAAMTAGRSATVSPASGIARQASSRPEGSDTEAHPAHGTPGVEDLRQAIPEVGAQEVAAALRTARRSAPDRRGRLTVRLLHRPYYRLTSSELETLLGEVDGAGSPSTRSPSEPRRASPGGSGVGGPRSGAVLLPYQPRQSILGETERNSLTSSLGQFLDQHVRDIPFIEIQISVSTTAEETIGQDPQVLLHSRAATIESIVRREATNRGASYNSLIVSTSTQSNGGSPSLTVAWRVNRPNAP